MPLIKRTVRPSEINRGHLTTEVAQAAFGGSISNELELTTNGSLACVVLQLSSLSRHVEDMFSELHRETLGLYHRTCHLSERIDRLKVKITQLNPTVEEVLLQDINTRKPFRSSVIKDQQIITLATRPVSIQEVYLRCEPPPALQKLNQYRQDGKDSLKFYTDDTYFFELWRIAMQKESKTQMKKHKQRSKQPYLTSDADSLRSGATSADTSAGSRLATDSLRSDKMYQARPAPGLQHALDQARTSARPQQSSMHDPASLARAGLQKMHAGEQPANIIIVDRKVMEASRKGIAGKVLQEMANQHQIGGHQMVDANAEHILASVRSDSSQPVLISSNNIESVDVRPRPSDLDVTDKTQLPTNHFELNTDATHWSSNLQTATGIVQQVEDLNLNDGVTQFQQDNLDMAGAVKSSEQSVMLGGPDVIPLAAEKFVYDPLPAVSGSTKSSTPDSADFLPPPPTPPPSSHPPDSPGSLPPPPTPPPPLEYQRRQSGDMIAAYRSGSPATATGTLASELPVSYAAVDVVGVKLSNGPSEASVARMLDGEMSGGYIELGKMSSMYLGTGDQRAGKQMGEKAASGEPPSVMDTRCDLLSAIREGIQLRKVEERRLKTEKRSRQPGRLDVQTIMETAFEMRRKALEENGSDEGEDEDDGLEGNWSDDD